MSRGTGSLVVALVSVIVCPLLLFLQLTAVLFAGMVTYEPSNPWFIKVASVLAVIIIGVVCLALPATAVVMGVRARRAAKSATAAIAGSSRATAGLIIAGVVIAGVGFVQAYLVLWAAGACSLDGCSS